MKKTRAEQFKEIAEKYNNNRPGFNCQLGIIRVVVADHGGLSIHTPINKIDIYSSDIPALYEFIKNNMVVADRMEDNPRYKHDTAIERPSWRNSRSY